MAKKKVNNKKPDTNTDYKPKRFTASHIMLYIVLAIYVIVSICGLIFVDRCMKEERYEYSAQVLIALFSYIGITVGSGFGFYCTKAKEENKLQITNAKYKMRFELAQKIFKENGNTLDDKSIDLLRKLMSDKDISEIPPVSEQVQPVWQDNVAQGDIDPTNIMNNDSEEGLG